MELRKQYNTFTKYPEFNSTTQINRKHMKYICIIIPLLIILFSGCRNAHNQKQNNLEKKIIAYIYPSNDTINVAKVNIDKLSHLNYSFAKISDNKIALETPIDSLNITLLKKHLMRNNSSCKLLISVGGWEFSDQFSDMASNSHSRAEFIESTLNFLTFFQLDGVDVDWEYPGQPGKTNNFRKEDKENFTLLLKELRKGLDSIGEIDKKHYLSSIAVPSFSQFYTNIQPQEVGECLDFINLMAYDFFGEWEPVSGHQSNLYSTANPKTLSADSAIKLLNSKGIPNEKIVLGIPFYSRSWKITSRSNHENINNYGHGAGINSNYEELAESYINKNGFKACWDSSACSPYLWNDSLQTFVTYDNPKSVAIKCKYIQTNKLAGTMFWKYNLEKENLLLNVIYDELK